jgi:hypothetical protein
MFDKVETLTVERVVDAVDEILQLFRGAGDSKSRMHKLGGGMKRRAVARQLDTNAHTLRRWLDASDLALPSLSFALLNGRDAVLSGRLRKDAYPEVPAGSATLGQLMDLLKGGSLDP